MITLPIWLFVLCVIIGFPLVIIILTTIFYMVYIGFKIVIETIKAIWGEL